MVVVIVVVVISILASIMVIVNATATAAIEFFVNAYVKICVLKKNRRNCENMKKKKLRNRKQLTNIHAEKL